jgi:hypothetical protein
MGIQIEFNPDLALRSYDKFLSGERKLEECLPENLTVGETYGFLKEGQRNYWLDGELPLLITKGGGDLSLPIASIIILEATHFKNDGKNYTKGRYLVKEVFDDVNMAHFNSYKKVL